MTQRIKGAAKRQPIYAGISGAIARAIDGAVGMVAPRMVHEWRKARVRSSALVAYEAARITGFLHAAIEWAGEGMDIGNRAGRTDASGKPSRPSPDRLLLHERPAPGRPLPPRGSGGGGDVDLHPRGVEDRAIISPPLILDQVAATENVLVQRGLALRALFSKAD